MKIGLEISRGKADPETRSIENPTVSVNSENFMQFFGITGTNLPAVTTESALTVPAFASGVRFLSRTMAAMPLHAFRDAKTGPEKITGKLETVIHMAPNETMGAFKMWQYFWQQVFTGGRGLAWIERKGGQVEALWAFNPARTSIKRVNFQVIYSVDGQDYPAEDVIDIPFMLRVDQLTSWGPVALASKAIQLALAMNDYGSKFFAGGGVPPLALTGPLPQGADALKRALADVNRAIDTAKASEKPLFALPGGHKLDPVGFDPAKGQMEEARKFQVIEIARALDLPPFFLQSLENAHFANAEQQDLSLVKHVIAHWAKALEDEMNLKLFGRMNNSRYVEFNLDGLQRGDFKTRIEGIVQGIQGGLLTPNEGRLLMSRPNHGNAAADELFIQGATVPIDKAGGQLSLPLDKPNGGTTK